MKKYYMLFLLLMGLVIKLSAQPCLPNGITFTTQSQIDSFAINYPGCNEIEGSVYIDGGYITNLNGLSVLNSIGESLIIGPEYFEYGQNVSLTSIEGLSNISSIGGSVFIRNNPVLESLNGLEGLTKIEGSLIIGGYSDGIPLLSDISALSNIDTVYGSLTVTGCPYSQSRCIYRY